MRHALRSLLAALLLLFAIHPVPAQDKADFTRTQDVIYGRKFGLSLTMDVFTPKKANGYGVVFVVSGGWFSSPASINPIFFNEVLRRGYTVFAVVHGSQPKFTVIEIVPDMHRAVRFIRTNAKKFHVDADHIGITGVSAGGHLSLLMGSTGGPGDPKAADPIDRASSAIQAVACFVPATDFLNWGGKGKELIDRDLQPPFTAAIDYHAFDKKKAMYMRITDKEALRKIARSISPAAHIKKGSAPSLIIHGEKDTLVPVQQAEHFVAKCKEAEVPAKLVVRKGEGHVWPGMLTDMSLFADWFDVYLRKIKKGE